MYGQKDGRYNQQQVDEEARDLKHQPDYPQDTQAYRQPEK
jgi:hypothetical protein